MKKPSQVIIAVESSTFQKHQLAETLPSYLAHADEFYSDEYRTVWKFTGTYWKRDLPEVKKVMKWLRKLDVLVDFYANDRKGRTQKYNKYAFVMTDSNTMKVTSLGEPEFYGISTHLYSTYKEYPNEEIDHIKEAYSEVLAVYNKLRESKDPVKYRESHAVIKAQAYLTYLLENLVRNRDELT